MRSCIFWTIHSWGFFTAKKTELRSQNAKKAFKQGFSFCKQNPFFFSFSGLKYENMFFSPHITLKKTTMALNQNKQTHINNTLWHGRGHTAFTVPPADRVSTPVISWPFPASMFTKVLAGLNEATSTQVVQISAKSSPAHSGPLSLRYRLPNKPQKDTL